MLDSLQKHLKNLLNIDPFIVISDFDFGFEINYDKSQIGIDRLVGLYAAKKLTAKKDIIVVDIGSAITIDVLKDNIFIGGIIVPGLDLMLKSLSQNTEQIGKIDFQIPEQTLGQNTRQAVSIGAFSAIKALINTYRQTYPDCSLVASGGQCEIFKNTCDFDYIEKILVLEGLNKIGGNNT